MSRAEIQRRYDQLKNKKNLSRRESGELAVCEAVLFNGGRITAQRDHTERGGGGCLLWFGAGGLASLIAAAAALRDVLPI